MSLDRYVLEDGGHFPREDGDWVKYEDVEENRKRLIAVVRAQHHAIDILFATLIYRTKDQQSPFFPSKSGAPWEAAVAGSTLMKELGEEL